MRPDSFSYGPAAPNGCPLTRSARDLTSMRTTSARTGEARRPSAVMKPRILDARACMRPPPRCECGITLAQRSVLDLGAVHDAARRRIERVAAVHRAAV